MMFADVQASLKKHDKRFGVKPRSTKREFKSYSHNLREPTAAAMSVILTRPDHRFKNGPKCFGDMLTHSNVCST